MNSTCFAPSLVQEAALVYSRVASKSPLHSERSFWRSQSFKASKARTFRQIFVPKESRPCTHLVSQINCTATSFDKTMTQPLKKIDFKKLQNGSDIRGVALEGVEGENLNLTEPVAEAIAQAFVKFLREKLTPETDRPLRISVGHDSRITADSLQQAVARGIAGEGAQVVLYGLASTPAMFNSTITHSEELLCPTDAGIMITASHLPFNRNGLKFFTKKGGASKGDISAILSYASEIYEQFSTEKLEANAEAASRLISRVDFMSHYASQLVETVRKGAGGREKPLEGFKLLVDAGNGAGGFFAEKVLQPLGADTTGSQFLEPDGMFPNHIPNPEDKKAMQAITEAVLKNKSDLGIIFDTDVDRAAAVDYQGKEINRNRLIALIAAIVLAEHPGTTVVTDSVTSDGLTDFIENKLGGKHLRFKRGYKNVIDEGIKRNNSGEECHLAIETSGHGALKENNWLDDGAYLIVKLLIKLASSSADSNKGSSILTNLIKDLPEAEISSELRLKIDESHPDIPSNGFKSYGESALAELNAYVGTQNHLTKAAVNYEGIRVSGYGGWFLLRLSLHDPILPLNIEAPSADAAKLLAKEVLTAIQKFEAIDVKSLEKYIASS